MIGGAFLGAREKTAEELFRGIHVFPGDVCVCVCVRLCWCQCASPPAVFAAYRNY